MSADPSALDPYRSPTLPDAPYAATGGSRRPGWLTALCVVCIVLGALGVTSGLFGVAGAALGETLQKAMSPKNPPGATDEMQQLSQQFQDQMNDVQQRFFAGILGAAIARIFVAGFLLFGGLQGLGLKERGRKMLLAACLAAIVFELGHMILQTLVNMEMMNAFNTFLEGLSQSLASSPGRAGVETMLGIMRGAMVFGMVLQYLLVLGKLVVYGWGSLYLRRPNVRAVFAP
ncbi:MAG: hypothetical protein SFU86_06300 [Pirellulaceae bacterium]|nr:hypothetical protein [Pirellulaceae bacterium]